MRTLSEKRLGQAEQSFRDGIISVKTLPIAEAERAVAELDRINWTPSTVGQKHDVFRINELVDLTQRNALSAGIDKASGLAADLLNYIKPAVCRAISDCWKIQIDKHSGIQFTKYNAGHFIRLHKDSGAAYPNRLFTAVTYLREDYVGGEIFFSQSGRRFHPAVGQTLIFPCDFAHGVDELVAGTKEIFLFFLDRNPRKSK